MSATAIATALGALGQIAGSYMTNMQNAKTQLAINKQNIGMQYALNLDQMAVAQMNNQTQIDLANTAHQREVNDLRDAGLNPILSATGGNGAAMPSLGGVNLDAPHAEAYRAESPMRELGTSARELGRLMSAQYEAEVDAAKANAEYAHEQVKALRQDTDVKRSLGIAAKEEARLEALLSHNKFNRISQDAMPIVRNLSPGSSDYELLGKALDYDKDGLFLLSPELQDDIYKGLKADIHNQKWSDVKGWLELIFGGMQSSAGAAASGAKALHLLKAL